jgi:septation ring formation regulator EzrA
MARLQKANRVIEVEESQVESYRLRGYDVIDDNGKVTKSATDGKKVTPAQYNKLKADYEELKAEKTTLPPAEAVDQEELERLKVEVKDLKEELRVMEEENVRLDGDLKKARGQNKR